MKLAELLLHCLHKLQSILRQAQARENKSYNFPFTLQEWGPFNGWELLGEFLGALLIKEYYLL